jgi:biopolymer transport protein ExbD/biopolymer transport protein TolR
MRRFSQRGHLVTLSEINITPLLDLAFVLLIIFVITTPLLEQGVSMSLPKGGHRDRPFEREDVRTVDVTGNGYRFQGRELTLEQLKLSIASEFQANPNLVVFIRADRSTAWDPVFQLMDVCSTLGIEFSARSEPRDTP